MKPIAVVGGALANKPRNGGEAWVRLSWVLGLRRLGFDAWLVEQIDSSVCTGADGEPADAEDSDNRRWFDEVVGRFGVSAALVIDDGARLLGTDRAGLFDLAADAALLVNVSGNLRWPELLARFGGPKVFVDIDPGFTQFWHVEGLGGDELTSHDAHYTVGLRIGARDCEIPTLGIRWRHIRPPVVLAEWPDRPAASLDRFTTVARWRGPFGSVQHGGKTYGLKVHEFRRFAGLPALAGLGFEVALDIHPADAGDRELLVQSRWRVVDPRAVAGDADAFRSYVQSSGAEFSVAQGMYVEARSGWMSDRTACYLASGSPALVQDTGAVSAREGLVTFSTLDEAVEGARWIERDYAAHCAAARAIAEEQFDSDAVIGRMLDEVPVRA